MKYAFPALRKKLKADSIWVRWCRELYRGQGGERLKAVLPFVEVTATTEPSDTFTSDVDFHTLTFALHAKGPDPSRIDNMIRETSRLLDHAEIVSANYQTAGTSLIDTDGPDVFDGVWQATMTYRMLAHYANKNPVTRGA